MVRWGRRPSSDSAAAGFGLVYREGENDTACLCGLCACRVCRFLVPIINWDSAQSSPDVWAQRAILGDHHVDRSEKGTAISCPPRCAGLSERPPSFPFYRNVRLGSFVALNPPHPPPPPPTQRIENRRHVVCDDAAMPCISCISCSASLMLPGPVPASCL